MNSTTVASAILLFGYVVDADIAQAVVLGATFLFAIRSLNEPLETRARSDFLPFMVARMAYGGFHAGLVGVLTFPIFATTELVRGSDGSREIEAAPTLIAFGIWWLVFSVLNRWVDQPPIRTLAYTKIADIPRLETELLGQLDRAPSADFESVPPAPPKMESQNGPLPEFSEKRIDFCRKQVHAILRELAAHKADRTRRLFYFLRQFAGMYDGFVKGGERLQGRHHRHAARLKTLDGGGRDRLLISTSTDLNRELALEYEQFRTALLDFVCKAVRWSHYRCASQSSTFRELGIHGIQRQDPWALAVILLFGAILAASGLCLATLYKHVTVLDVAQTCFVIAGSFAIATAIGFLGHQGKLDPLPSLPGKGAAPSSGPSGGRLATRAVLTSLVAVMMTFSFGAIVKAGFHFVASRQEIALSGDKGSGKPGGAESVDEAGKRRYSFDEVVQYWSVDIKRSTPWQLLSFTTGLVTFMLLSMNQRGTAWLPLPQALFGAGALALATIATVYLLDKTYITFNAFPDYVSTIRRNPPPSGFVFLITGLVGAAIGGAVVPWHFSQPSSNT